MRRVPSRLLLGETSRKTEIGTRKRFLVWGETDNGWERYNTREEFFEILKFRVRSTNPALDDLGKLPDVFRRLLEWQPTTDRLSYKR